jgi:lysosomal Pro-X carboxypeptidase
MTFARGLGADFFWPPSHPRSVSTYDDIVKNMTSGPCPDPDGVYGFSKEPYDLWSSWLEAYYGAGLNMDGHSNIIFSNGLLDPWSAGGVYAEHPWEKPPYSGPMLQHITETDVIALIIETGGHHSDLMYSSKSDPDSVTRARQIQRDYLVKWIESFRKQG